MEMSMSVNKELKWGEDQSKKLEDLARQYFEADEKIKQLAETKSVLKAEIGKLMDLYQKKKVVTEGFSVGYTHIDGSRSFNSAVAKAKLLELKIEIDDTFYKIGKSYERLDINKNEVAAENDPHRVTVSLEDLKM
jgi:hypothetical protein